MLAKVVDENNDSILVYCCSGTDHTPLLVSTTMILLDPFFRTIKGFIVLVEKEWLSFSHKFWSYRSNRCAIFLSWLDAVHQILRQFPCAFEYNNAFLVDILDEVFICRFGTFLCDSDYERQSIPHKTLSAWSSILDTNNIKKYRNPLYESFSKKLRPAFYVSELVLWEYFVKPRKVIQSDIMMPETKALQLTEQNASLQKQMNRKQYRPNSKGTSSPSRSSRSGNVKRNTPTSSPITRKFDSIDSIAKIDGKLFPANSEILRRIELTSNSTSINTPDEGPSSLSESVG
jgi:hypothetical protein